MASNPCPQTMLSVSADCGEAPGRRIGRSDVTYEKENSRLGRAVHDARQPAFGEIAADRQPALLGQP
ncbi:hypothetical protein GCM10028792_20850 [Salinisphaera aquimarina]